MHETNDDLTRLQDLLDHSRERAGHHLRRAFGESATTATDIVTSFAGIFEMHFAVVTSAGAPLVAPLDGLLFHGQIWFGLPAGSVRARLVRREPRVSASFTKDATAFIVHGAARELEPTDPLAGEFDGVLRELYVERYGPGWNAWYDAQRRANRDAGFTGWIEAGRMFAKS